MHNVCNEEYDSLMWYGLLLTKDDVRTQQKVPALNSKVEMRQIKREAIQKDEASLFMQ